VSNFSPHNVGGQVRDGEGIDRMNLYNGEIIHEKF